MLIIGVVVAVIGMEVGGCFEVEQVISPGFPVKSAAISPITEDSYLIFCSGLSLSEGSTNAELVLSFIEGTIGVTSFRALF
jgi:hypothetical protein